MTNNYFKVRGSLHAAELQDRFWFFDDRNPRDTAAAYHAARQADPPTARRSRLSVFKRSVVPGEWSSVPVVGATTRLADDDAPDSVDHSVN